MRLRVDITSCPLTGASSHCVLYILNMNSSIPDSISTSDLQNLIETATPEKPSMENATDEEMLNFVVDKIEALTDEFGTTFSYKLIADYCIYKLLEHHNEAYAKYFKEGESQAALCWARDAGHLQVIGKTLRDIQCGPTDFLCPED